MELNQSIIRLLQIIKTCDTSQIQDCLRGDEQSMQLITNNTLLAQITPQQLMVSGTDLTEKLVAKNQKYHQEVRSKEMEDFVDDLGDSILRVNHLGISYAVSDISLELVNYQKIIAASPFDLYEEESGDAFTKWLFIGNTQNWDQPLFEIVLTQNTRMPENAWRPHFQIDLDTNLETNILEEKITKHFGNHFVNWKLDIPNYGTVLEMGRLGSVGGTKIYLSISTCLRDTPYSREHILKKIG